jgi:hypothetical protein
MVKVRCHFHSLVSEFHFIVWGHRRILIVLAVLLIVFPYMIAFDQCRMLYLSSVSSNYCGVLCKMLLLWPRSIISNVKHSFRRVIIHWFFFIVNLRKPLIISLLVVLLRVVRLIRWYVCIFLMVIIVFLLTHFSNIHLLLIWTTAKSLVN